MQSRSYHLRNLSMIAGRCLLSRLRTPARRLATAASTGKGSSNGFMSSKWNLAMAGATAIGSVLVLRSMMVPSPSEAPEPAEKASTAPPTTSDASSAILPEEKSPDHPPTAAVERLKATADGALPSVEKMSDAELKEMMDMMVADAECPTCVRTALEGPCGLRLLALLLCYARDDDPEHIKHCAATLSQPIRDCMEEHSDYYGRAADDDEDNEDEKDKTEEKPNDTPPATSSAST